MFVDWQKNSSHASCFDIFDATSGENLDSRPIFYACEETGIVREYLRDESGQFYCAPGNKDEVAWKETVIPGGIRIVLKPPIDVTGLWPRGWSQLLLDRRAFKAALNETPNPAKPETWRDRPPLL